MNVVHPRSTPYLAAMLITLPAILPGQQGAFDMTPGFFPRAWSERLAPQVAQATSFDIYGRRLLAAGNTDDGAFLAFFAIEPSGGIADSWRYGDLDAIPHDLRIDAVQVVWASQRLFLFGNHADRAHLFSTTITQAGELGEWQALPHPELSGEERVHSTFVDDFSLVVLTSKPGEQGSVLRAFSTDVRQLTNGGEWTELPTLATERNGFGTAQLRQRLLVLGGSHIGGDGQIRPSFMPDTLTWPHGEEWAAAPPGFQRPPRDTVATSHGMVVFAAEKSGDANADTQGTNMIIQQSGDIGEGNLGLWRPIRLDQAPAAIRTMLIDPPSAQLLVITELPDGENLVVSAYQLSTVMVGRRRSEDEAITEALRTIAVEIPNLSRSAFQDQINRSGLGLFVITGPDDAEDVRVRASFNNSSIRYMMTTLPVAYFRGAVGAEIMAEFGVTETPAYVLVDDSNRVLERHSGSVATPEQMFRLTAPSRDPEFRQNRQR